MKTRFILPVLTLVFSLGVSYALAWSGPSASPPNGNTPAPVNVGATTQTKSGDICTSAGGGQCLSISQIGSGQTWQQMNRSFGAVYANTTGRTIVVGVTGINGGAASRYYVYVNGIIVSALGGSFGGQATGVQFIVPAGSTYSIDNPDDPNPISLASWSELR